MKVSPANRRGLNIGMGRRARLISERRSASADDLMPSATSATAARNRAEPWTGPSASSSARRGTGQIPRCTDSATTARTSRMSVVSRTASATARGAST